MKPNYRPACPYVYMLLGDLPQAWRRFANAHGVDVKAAIHEAPPSWWVFDPHDIASEVARRSHEGISHSPEVRAVQVRAEFASSLNASVRETLRAAKETPAAEAAALAVWEAAKPTLKQKYTNYLSAKGNVTSWLVTGRSGRNERREQKKMQTEQNRYTEFGDLTKKVAKNAIDAAKATLVQEAGGPDAVDRQRLAKLEQWLQTMKDVNKVARKKSLSDEEKVAQLVALGLTASSAHTVLNPDLSYLKPGFQAYELTSVRSKIKRLHASIEERAKREEVAADVERQTTWSFDEAQSAIGIAGEVEYDYADDRLRISFANRLPREDFQAMRSRGFRWSRSYEAFSRHLRNTGVREARAVSGLDLPWADK